MVTKKGLKHKGTRKNRGESKCAESTLTIHIRTYMI